MKTLSDTSILVASLVESHPMHERAFSWLKQAKSKAIEMIVAGIDRLLTFNSDHFKRVWPDGENVIFTP